MTTAMETPANARQAARLEEVVRQVLREALTRGFYGNAAVEFSVQDGTIQWIRRRVEKLER